MQRPSAAPFTPGPSLPPTAAGAGGAVVWRRVGRVLRLDRSVYPEVERDPAGTRQAVAIVVVMATTAAVGTVLAGTWYPGAILGAVLATVVHWLLWSGLDHLIARALYRTPMSLEHSARALGYAQAPELLALLAFVPLMGPWVVLGSRLLTMLAGTQAVTTTLQLRRRQALAIRLVSFGLALAGGAVVRAVLGDVPFLTALLRP